eukprot:scaffold1937_cov120-Isochrysis_galbana.AAC.5
MQTQAGIQRHVGAAVEPQACGGDPTSHHWLPPYGKANPFRPMSAHPGEPSYAAETLRKPASFGADRHNPSWTGSAQRWRS